MEKFILKSDAYRKMMKQSLIRTVPLLLVATFAGLFIADHNSPHTQDEVNILPFVIPATLALVGYGVYRGLKRQSEFLKSYSLTIDQNSITREQKDTPAIQFLVTDVSEIYKTSNGSFIIKASSTNDVIMVPVDVEKYSNIEALLNSIQPVQEHTPASFKPKYGMVLSLFSLALLLTVNLATNTILVAVSGTAFLSLMVWTLYTIHTSKNIDYRTKRKRWVIWLVMASVITVMYFKLTNSLG
ncbi:MAG: hypothetical protein JWQ40_4404 [Segetibacter sp.]|nr:hypothetical protein [Segetibacter sp.]